MGWLEGLLNLVEKKLGARASRIITWLIIVGALLASFLWLITWSIDKQSLLIRFYGDLIKHGKAHRIQVITFDVGPDKNIILSRP